MHIISYNDKDITSDVNIQPKALKAVNLVPLNEYKTG